MLIFIVFWSLFKWKFLLTPFGWKRGRTLRIRRWLKRCRNMSSLFCPSKFFVHFCPRFFLYLMVSEADEFLTRYHRDNSEAHLWDWNRWRKKRSNCKHSTEWERRNYSTYDDSWTTERCFLILMVFVKLEGFFKDWIQPRTVLKRFGSEGGDNLRWKYFIGLKMLFTSQSLMILSWFFSTGSYAKIMSPSLSLSYHDYSRHSLFFFY